MTPAKYTLPLGTPVSLRVRFADVVPGEYGSQVRLKALVDGEARTVYLPGTAADAVTALHAGGALASLDVPPLTADSPGVALVLTHHELVLAREAVPGTKRSRLVVTTNGAPAPAVAVTPAPFAGVTPGPAALPVVSASESLEAKRAGIVATFGAALDAVIAEYAPRFAAQRIALSDDVVYRCAFTLFSSWRDAGLLA